ncbi:MAG TPA: hypothetical protein VK789_23110 [Bryobacteraceae bacterium]|jgi:hypothetical protein|nr:hypothetical protein [Bryobacteraceae bacterium]
MRQSPGCPALLAACAFVLALAGALTAATAPQESDLYTGWLKMYDLKFDDAHRTFGAWKQSHPDDSFGPASNAAAYLFSELARLGALESEFFVDDSRFKNRAQLRPDPASRALFTRELAQADRLAAEELQKSSVDSNALFVKSLIFGLRADDAGLVEKQPLAALSYTKVARIFAERLAQAKPDAADAYFGPGIENYLLSLRAAPVRVLLRVTGSNVDREKGLEEIRETALHGHYLEPFAKLLLAGAALRDNNPVRARELLWELHKRFPDNELYTREIDRIDKNAH